MLTEDSILRAIQHLAAVGDTDLFPRLPEAAYFAQCSEEVAKLASQMNLGNYHPVSSVEVLTPKSEFGFRIGHQLTSTDTLMYTAAVIENADGIQKLRDDNSQDVPFSYRYDPAGGQRLFETNRGYHDWLGYLSNFGDGGIFDDPKAVLETDIADFYQRIYFHRVENILNDVNASRSSSGTIKKVIQVCRSKQSFGLPVGSSASRLLAEGLLCDTDRMLLDMDLTASRYVDDYRIVANERYNTHTILCRLAEHLMVTEGLSLNASKTRIVDTQSLHLSAQQKMQDVFTNAELLALRKHLDASYAEEEIDVDDQKPDNPFLDGDDLLDRLDELKKQGGDFSSRKAILKVLRNIQAFDAVRLLRDHSDLAYHLPRDFCRAIRASNAADFNEPKVLEAAVWELMQRPPISELSYARLWLLNLYTNGTLPVDRKLIEYQIAKPSALEERQLIFIRARLNDRPFFREHRGKLGQLGEWSKPALLIGGACLPDDEYRAWLDIAVRQLADPFAAGFVGWLKKGIDIEAVLSV